MTEVERLHEALHKCRDEVSRLSSLMLSRSMSYRFWSKAIRGFRRFSLRGHNMFFKYLGMSVGRYMRCAATIECFLKRRKTNAMKRVYGKQ